jgi:hypothetical protein
LDSVSALEVSQTNSAAAKLVETAIAKFKTTHPYLLFHNREIARIRRLVSRNSKLLAR